MNYLLTLLPRKMRYKDAPSVRQLNFAILYTLILSLSRIKNLQAKRHFMDYPKKKSVLKTLQGRSTAQHYEIFFTINSTRVLPRWSGASARDDGEAISLPAYVHCTCCERTRDWKYMKWSNTGGWKDEKMFAFNDHFTFHITEKA